MQVIIALVAGLVFTTVFHVPLRKFPAAFYVAATIIAVLFISGLPNAFFPALARIVYPYVQHCLFAFALFIIVMFIGVLPKQGVLRSRLQPIRGSLSIIAAILATVHFAGYMIRYVIRMIEGFTGITATMMASLLVAFILVALLATLTLTSFVVVRAHMSASIWQKLQRLSYVFFALVFVHIGFILGPSAVLGGNSLPNVIVYACILTLYTVMRLIRWRLDRAVGEKE
jgi:DMSO/TMAO reductase YedYZ heme-binding membrane subunit